MPILPRRHTKFSLPFRIDMYGILIVRMKLYYMQDRGVIQPHQFLCTLLVRNILVRRDCGSEAKGLLLKEEHALHSSVIFFTTL